MRNLYRTLILVMLTVGGVFLLMFGLLFASATVGASDQPSKGIRQTITLVAVRDNTLYQSAAGTVSNGAGAHFFVGQTQNGQVRRGVVAFDVAEALPSGATVVSATLSLSMSKTRGGETAVSLHTIQQDWGEGSSNADSNEGAGALATTGDATWFHTFFDTNTWSQPGGDFDEIPLATTMVGGNGRYQWHSVELTEAVTSWYTHPLDNFGLMLIGDKDTSGSAKRFDTRENPTPANHPTLTIAYTLPAPAIKLYLPIIRR